MSANLEREMVTITINDLEVQVPKGELIVEAVKRIKQEVPIFCYHHRMTPVGMCRMCVIEVGFRQPDGTSKMMPKPQTACTLPASEGMVIYTDTAAVHKDRKGVLEFLLINHPLDCPVCDRGGECPLQNNTLFYGPSTSRYVEMKRHLPKAYPLSKHVTLDLERCIQCGRCVRFTEEISGDGQLAFRFRGAQMQPTTFELTDFDSKFSGNTIEICPVGALTNSNYRFRARPWDLETNKGICTNCSNGCNIWLDHRVGKLLRVNGRTNEAVNEEWTCDKGKFGQEFYTSSKRLYKPLIRKGDQFVEASWPEAYAEILNAFSIEGNQVAALTKANYSNEGLYLLQKLFRGYFKSNNIDHRWTKYLQSASNRLEYKAGMLQVQTPLSEIENKQNILVFGTSLADEEPILYLKLRKAWFHHKTNIICAHSSRTEVEGFAKAVLRYKSTSGSIFAVSLLNAIVNLTDTSISHELKQSLKKYEVSNIQSETGVDQKDVLQAAKMLIEGKTAIITTQNLMNQPDGQEILDILGAISLIINAEFNCYGLQATDQAAEDLGLLPDLLPGGFQVTDENNRAKIEELYALKLPKSPGYNTLGILNGCISGTIKALWLANVNPITECYDQEMAKRALEGADFIVYQAVLETEAMSYANVVLPMQAPAEQDGSYTNLERRIQRMSPALKTCGEAKSDWRIFAELMLRQKPTTPYFNSAEVLREMSTIVPWYTQISYEKLKDEGLLVKPNLESLSNIDFLIQTFQQSALQIMTQERI